MLGQRDITMPDHDHAFECAQIDTIERLRGENTEMY